ncbi:MAG: putative manganese transporter [archaeon]|nr:putative manganese transporter [archaeon]
MELLNIFQESLSLSIKIALLIFVLMIVVELVVLKYERQILGFVKRSKFLSYFTSSFFGAIPGCTGTFAIDSLYMCGLVSFGSIVAVMISTCGDEAFLLLSMVAAGKISFSVVLYLVFILFLLGVAGGYIADCLVRKFDIKLCRNCAITYHKNVEFKFRHFIKEHIYEHIVKKHMLKIFFWLFASIFIIEVAQGYIDANALFSGSNMFYVLLIASLIGLLPISGPNVFFIVMFSEGLIPFSVLLANSIIQDGHGLLPIMGFSLNDFVKIKMFNFVFGLAVGLILLIIGL